MGLDRKTAEFNRLLAASGWSQAEAARRLKITPGAVSQICNGRTRPHGSTLNLFRLMIGRHKGGAALKDGAAQPLEAWERQVLGALRGMSDRRREQLLPALMQMIETWAAAGRGGKA
jgi:transcriptional regulator with XRE-family HTH domain